MDSNNLTPLRKGVVGVQFLFVAFGATVLVPLLVGLDPSTALFTAENTLLIGSILLFVSIVVGKTGYRFGVPTLLLFLVVGMLFGSDGLGLQFHDAKDAQFIGMVALSIILFSGGMDTKFREIKPLFRCIFVKKGS